MFSFDARSNCLVIFRVCRFNGAVGSGVPGEGGGRRVEGKTEKTEKRRKEKDDQVAPIIKASRRAQPDAFSQKKTKTENAPKTLTHPKNTKKNTF